MYYLTTYECNKKVYSVAAAIEDFANATDEDIITTIHGSVEYGKTLNGLIGAKHAIKSVKMSMDTKTWFMSSILAKIK